MKNKNNNMGSCTLIFSATAPFLCAEFPITALDYKELIIKMIQGVRDKWVVEQIYRYAKNMTKED